VRSIWHSCSLLERLEEEGLLELFPFTGHWITQTNGSMCYQCLICDISLSLVFPEWRHAVKHSHRTKRNSSQTQELLVEIHVLITKATGIHISATSTIPIINQCSSCKVHASGVPGRKIAFTGVDTIIVESPNRSRCRFNAHMTWKTSIAISW
jgi:hypothetical protein